MAGATRLGDAESASEVRVGQCSRVPGIEGHGTGHDSFLQIALEEAIVMVGSIQNSKRHQTAICSPQPYAVLLRFSQGRN
jgi:hypothetical protein